MPGISVIEHMINVGRVAQFIAETSPELLWRFHLKAKTVGVLAALHDLGKISPGFQRKCAAWLKEHRLLDIDKNYCWDTSMEGNHGKVTHAALQQFLYTKGVSRQSSSCIAALLGAHHGYLHGPADSRPFRVVGISENHSGINWDNERTLAADSVLEEFGSDPSDFALVSSDPAVWWLAGLTTVSDWIGSDERFFPPEGGIINGNPSERAQNALRSIGLEMTPICKGLCFSDLFGFPSGTKPNNMQIRARELIQGPGVYVIEAPMGMGKTEAALWAGYDLLAEGKAKGIFFALPTQATSNRIHLRMNEYVKRIAPTAGSSRLIHGNSWLMQSCSGISLSASADGQINDARTGIDWFASAKRSLLAPFGVGTIDQALLGVLAAKHFFVRHFALAGKIVILDEVHSYDLYTGTLIDRLIDVLKGLGCTVIVLSATLTGKRRGQMVYLDSDSETDPAEMPYPMISGAPEGSAVRMVEAQAPSPKRVQVEFRHTDAAMKKAMTAASQGSSVLWICNTVSSAQEHFERIKNETDARVTAGLLHSRFPFWRREDLENEWMSRLGKNSENRHGCILVSTQVVEQSVDLDADLLVTELAPSDMLFQRIGRLWRHDRPGRKGTPQMVILEETHSLEVLRGLDPKSIISALEDKSFVYSPYVLLRTLEVWRNRSEVTIPDDIRGQIEATYEDRMEGEEPEAWQKLYEEMAGKVYAFRQKALQASNIWTVALEDEERVQTRLNEQPTVSLVLCKSLSLTNCTFLDNSTGTWERREFEIELAQKIHKNLVRIPRHIFSSIKNFEAFKTYLHGEFVVGIVCQNRIQVDGLRNGVVLKWSLEQGVRIEKIS